MTYEETLAYIHSVSWKGSRPGLSRITELMAKLGNPEKKLKYIHIAGTNGKGSTAAMLSSVLTAAGYRTGLFTSPYITCFRERMQINNEMISEKELAGVTEYVRPFADAMEDKPTEFELITAIGLQWFAERSCDIVVLEAGMGGALDSTNVIPAPEAAVFTNIGLDHTEYLGDTVEKIAATKAGILKPGCAAVLYPNAPAAEYAIENRCGELGIPLSVPDFSALTLRFRSLTRQTFDYGSLKKLYLHLPGEHQLKNCAVALETLKTLKRRGWNVPVKAIRTGIAAAKWPARFEVLSDKPPVILDGGHNPQCMQALSAAVRAYLPQKKVVMLTGVLADKDYGAMYAEMLPLAAEIFTVTPPNPRALSAADLKSSLEKTGIPVTACDTLREGAERALRAAKDRKTALIAFGSLYMAGELRELFTGLPADSGK